MTTLKTLLASISLAALSPATAQERLIILDEGIWQADNGRLSYFEQGSVVSNQWFRDKNGYKLGDTPSDIVQVSDELIAIAVNWSNIVQFISPDGRAVAATEDVPNNRCLATDGRYVYVTSYGHECQTTAGMKQFTRGYVAKIDVGTFRVVAATELGYEPEGIALYGGHLFVANTGGYAAQEDHDYEQTVSIVDAETMTLTGSIDLGQPNLFGDMAQSGQYLCINSPGDYYGTEGCSFVFDCERALQGRPDCYVRLQQPATYSTVTADGRFLTIGSDFSYVTGEYQFSCAVIDPAQVMATQGADGIATSLPGTMKSDIENMGQPYAIYMNPYTGYYYATDAQSFENAGRLYQWTPEGRLLGSHKVYINPGHMMALPPDGQSFSAVRDIHTPHAETAERTYDLTGRPARSYKPGQVYVRQGRKELRRQ
ncbi:MAG: beta-propeller domain-containing protein [Prevotella sp.]|nr:beta-propeller domain-containing protein [Prevotella sp.]